MKDDIDFWIANDCPHFTAFDDGDDYPPNRYCEKSKEWLDGCPEICYQCRGDWTIKQIEQYVEENF